MSAVPERNRRLGKDRRSKPTRCWDAFRFAGRRLRNRRADEHDQPYFVDRFPATTLVWVLALLILSITDGVITLVLVDGDCQESNPLLGYLLDKGPICFLLGKYLLTAAGLPILFLFKNYFLFDRRLRVGYLIPCFVLLYFALTVYQIYLIQQSASRMSGSLPEPNSVPCASGLARELEWAQRIVPDAQRGFLPGEVSA